MEVITEGCSGGKCGEEPESKFTLWSGWVSNASIGMYYSVDKPATLTCAARALQLAYRRCSDRYPRLHVSYMFLPGQNSQRVTGNVLL